MQWNKNNIQADLADYRVYGFEAQGNHVIPPHFQPEHFSGDTMLWLLPCEDAGEAYQIKTGPYEVEKADGGILISLPQGYTCTEYPARPACDFFGKYIRLDIENGPLFEKAWARFYWDNLLMQVAERTFMREMEDIREGYVLSTLDTKAYAGTYPAVDHEFHMKGRFAVAGEAEASLLRRMLQLQMKIMREDERGESRNVCSIQPNGDREYDIWRESNDDSCVAQMFRITANIEFVEGMHQYYCLTKDLDFLQESMDALEKNCGYIEHFIRKDGLLCAHVYYEDQVIKDGQVTQAQCFAVNSFRLMAKLEALLNRNDQAQHYTAMAELLGETVGRDFPAGYWDNRENRFIDWIDSKGAAHDHIHLLANELPVLFGLTSERQAAHCAALIEEYDGVFSKFPSFVAAKIEDYTRSEYGNSPYDLCAAGRYWCWDAEYLAFNRNAEQLQRQLLQVARQAELDGFLMGERYDMNYVYYNTGEDALRNWHGASLYYEYPNVFLYVLVCKYLGIRRGFESDLIVDPLLTASGSVTHEGCGISYTVDESFTLKNISGAPLCIEMPAFKKTITLEPDEVFQQTLR